MAQFEDRVILAIECGHCRQLTGVQVYNDTLYIVRCGACGQSFRAVDDLAHQYESYANRIEHHESLCRTFQEVLLAMKLALEHWGRKAGKEALVRVLDKEKVGAAKTDNGRECS